MRYDTITKSIKLLLVGVCLSCLFSCEEKHQFQLLRPSDTQVFFENTITEYDSFNILTFEYVYNGGGVALADFTNDGLDDVFFTGNMVSNQLYINKGAMEFEDVTAQAGVGAADRWCSGVAVVDINADGWKDIYVCATVKPQSSERKNLLFVNQGIQDGVPVFKEMAEAYGIADTSHTTTAAFFDYDRDGDLDLYLAVNEMDQARIPNVYKKSHTDAKIRVDKLYRNDQTGEGTQPVFTDVSTEAGIIYEGYSLGVNVADLNQDGWSDIYVTNDYLTQDLVYINNQDGTFTNRSKDYLAHTSYSAMGNDVVDINNDARPDIMAVDMLPEDNYRKKTMMMGNNYTNYINNERYGYQYQCVRNTFQVNQGMNPRSGEPVFGDVAFMAGVSSTDWSWAPLVADFDNDGLRDLIITNGFPKDVTDRDFSDYSVEVARFASKKLLLSKIPSVKIKNYAYKNVDGLRFENVTEDWGVRLPSFSNGAAYADLDNDGDLDYVVNNINDPAFIYENKSTERQPENRWLKVTLKGIGDNPDGLGAKVRITTDLGTHYWEQSPYRGYLSSVGFEGVIGLGAASAIRSVEVVWPSGRQQTLTEVLLNQEIVLDESNAANAPASNATGSSALLAPLAEDSFDGYVHIEEDFIDFNVQPLLPHKLSQYGPGLAAGDVNGDGLDDLYVGGSLFEKGVFLLQNEQGQFEQKDLLTGASNEGEELGVLLFDADLDGDLDLYLANGSNEFAAGDTVYQDRLYENVNGEFVHRVNALPEFLWSSGAVRAADYDADGDLDLFVAGRQVPHLYPAPASSYLFKNVSTTERLVFELDGQASELFKEIGMITDALWSDFDGDGDADLVTAGEWMSIQLFQNTDGQLTNVTQAAGLNAFVGWWNSLVAGDFDGDGDMDYLAGNLGLNSINQGSPQHPVTIYAADFDQNGGWDAVPGVYLPGPSGALQEYPYFGRPDMIKQMTRIKDQFAFHAQYAQATLPEMFREGELDSALAYKANYMQSAYLENQGDGTFTVQALPLEAQVAPVYGMLPKDVDSDGHLDVMIVGNDYGTEVMQGRLDAFKGLVLKGDGTGHFVPVPLTRSGFYVPKDAKALVELRGASGRDILVASQNQGELRAFSIGDSAGLVISLQPNDFQVTYRDANNQKVKREVYYGHTYLSQNSRYVRLPAGATEVMVTSFDGKSRKL
ncbi:VCBS repeat-containing protein [Marinoscillum furvescens]|uniref:VCBS repeat protein n=1 Tax=Marinoscillum furvescens DSM 4134 TaxID=1122208 RepID=A0A3D9L5U9_MARFU|nr:VCBS repeat-containing protein [Marinoscillum furvescens]RED99802.1 VCBS repeat protein [Marinoscillum furvescens DSM 4134]